MVFFRSFPSIAHSSKVIALVIAALSSLASGPAMSQSMTGEKLYGLVETYSEMGIHRVGTDVDRQTNKWFGDQLEALGGKVELQPFKFDLYESTTTVTIDGKEIPSMALYYEAVGSVESDKPHVASLVATTGDRTSQALTDEITKAKAAGAEIAVIATENSAGELATPNRFPKLGSGLPVVLVPGRYGDALKSGTVHVSFSGKIVPGESHNIIASFGDVSGKPLVIATPMSGWFTCAAERATGIAVAIALAERFATGHPVLVIGSPGHEILHHIGLEAFLENNNKIDAALILHLGANVALGQKDPATGKVRLAPGIDDPKALPEYGRTVFVRMDEQRYSTIKPALANADLPAVLNPPKWNGEGELWANGASGPLMSFTGIDPLFHTPGDIPENTTSPEALETVYAALAEAVETFLADGKN